MSEAHRLTGLDQDDIEVLGETLALALAPGDLVALTGDLGAGKTTLARATIRTALADPSAEVPSPTFSLVQAYENSSIGTLLHVDLYRLEDGSDIADLGLEEALEHGAVLVEWPDRAAGALPPAALVVAIEDAGPDHRNVSLSGPAANRVKRSLAIRDFLNTAGLKASRRQHLTGDASSRAYETIIEGGHRRVLMNSPATPDGPIIAKYGVPYSRVAHLAEDVRPFVAVANALRAKGFTAPAIEAMSLDEGLLLIDDLGAGQIVTSGSAPIAARYEAAMECLAAMHELSWSDHLSVAPGEADHIVPEFDRRSMLAEISLLPDWYAAFRLGQRMTQAEELEFEQIWNSLIDTLSEAEMSLVLRDYHSPNIIWREGENGLDRVGLIDFQDAMIGPAAYDVASLAQDARVDVSAELEAALLDLYCSKRDEGFDEPRFRATYAIMAAQRATKIAGIFVRLSQRDGKDGYLKHLPRIESYLTRSMKHPALSTYQAWWNRIFG